jgi:hypothetical protein
MGMFLFLQDESRHSRLTDTFRAYRFCLKNLAFAQPRAGHEPRRLGERRKERQSRALAASSERRNGTTKGLQRNAMFNRELAPGGSRNATLLTASIDQMLIQVRKLIAEAYRQNQHWVTLAQRRSSYPFGKTNLS